MVPISFNKLATIVVKWPHFSSMRAQLSFWSLYSLDESMVNETNFDVLKHLNPAKIDEKKLMIKIIFKNKT